MKSREKPYEKVCGFFEKIYLFRLLLFRFFIFFKLFEDLFIYSELGDLAIFFDYLICCVCFLMYACYLRDVVAGIAAVFDLNSTLIWILKFS